MDEGLLKAGQCEEVVQVERDGTELRVRSVLFASPEVSDLMVAYLKIIFERWRNPGLADEELVDWESRLGRAEAELAVRMYDELNSVIDNERRTPRRRHTLPKQTQRTTQDIDVP